MDGLPTKRITDEEMVAHRIAVKISCLRRHTCLW